jgi:hypothetical protein
VKHSLEESLLIFKICNIKLGVLALKSVYDIGSAFFAFVAIATPKVFTP